MISATPSESADRARQPVAAQPVGHPEAQAVAVGPVQRTRVIGGQQLHGFRAQEADAGVLAPLFEHHQEPGVVVRRSKEVRPRPQSIAAAP